MKHLTKGVAADSLDDYTGMAASTIYMYVKKFMDALLWIFNDRYMRHATTEDTKRLLAENEARGFPGMLESLDCTHWEWRCCPTDEAGRHVGQYKKPNLVLQAVASYERWFWHCYFSAPGANNDLNVLDQSGLFDREKNALDPPCEFRINGHVYRHGYYLVDEIYNEMPGVVHGYKRRQTMPAIHKKFNEYHDADSDPHKMRFFHRSLMTLLVCFVNPETVHHHLPSRSLAGFVGWLCLKFEDLKSTDHIPWESAS
ncbi:uncharacterized protein LOC113316431 [Papaver somniferum]|uniref:uncharacterized protein LOC113316431 n=1 Tax=Papaver somniferum TaxID=3469 RepID=UPI000E6F69DA|nr:uncharacterized protein LOC113316431 [Papaver somniferum]